MLWVAKFLSLALISLSSRIVRCEVQVYCSNNVSAASESNSLQRQISDGIFRLSGNNETLNFKEVLLLQRNYAIVNFICARIPKDMWIPRHFFCNCLEGRALSLAQSHEVRSRFPGQAQEWCLQRPCLEAGLSECKVNVDPFRESCIVVTKQARKRRDVKSDTLNVAYDLVTPTIDITNLIDYIGHFADHISIDNHLNLTETAPSESIKTASAKLPLEHVDHIIVSSYAANAIAGFVIVLLSDILSSSSLVQYTLVTLFGVLYGATGSSLTLLRLLRVSAVGRNGLLPPSIINLLLLIFVLAPPSTFFNNSRVLVLFYWGYGAFDLRWLGKAIFAAAAVTSIAVTYSLKLFQKDTLSHHILRRSIQLAGLWILKAGTPNTELSALFMLLALSVSEVISAQRDKFSEAKLQVLKWTWWENLGIWVSAFVAVGYAYAVFATAQSKHIATDAV